MRTSTETHSSRTFDEKDLAIVARNRDDRSICGFSTQMIYDQQVGHSTVHVLFSGDTIVDRRFWGDNPLAQLWGRLALSLIDQFPHDQLYWFLISKGYKTYRFLPVFFREFYPRYDCPTPPWARTVISEIATARFGQQFCASTGILKATEESCRLRRTVAELTTHRLKNPHLAYFNQANPGHIDGDELCCIAPLSRDNFCRTAFQVIGQPSLAQQSPIHVPSVSAAASRGLESGTQ